MAVNRIKTTSKLSALQDEYYRNMPGYDKIAWCMGPIPYELMTAAGIGNFLTENTAARIAGDHRADEFIAYAEAAGLSNEVCSYAKINIAQALMMVDGKEEEMIPERLRLPRPDMVALGNSCPSMMQWAKCIAQIFDVPLFVLDQPFNYAGTDEEYKRCILYCKEQLKEFVDFLENLTGRPIDWDGLKETLADIREMTFVRSQIFNACKFSPVPASFIDNVVGMMPALTMKNKAAVQFYKDFLEEETQRIRTGDGTCKNEKYRIMWRGNFPWYKISALSKLMDKYDAVLVTGQYGFKNYGEYASRVIKPDGFDLNDPLLTIAGEYAVDQYALNFENKFNDDIRHYIDDMNIDAVIIHSPHTCRPWGMTTYDMAARIEEEYDIPALVLELDHTDERYYSDAQVETRVKALLEAVDAKRADKGHRDDWKKLSF